MPVYQIDTEKALNGRTWSNRYLFLVDSIEIAQTTAFQVVEAEQSIAGTQIQFTKMRVSDFGVNSPQYVTTPLNLTGQRVIADLLPLFNVIRIDMFAGNYDPGRKYLHGSLGEGDQTNGTLTTIALDLFTVNYAEVVQDLGGYIIGSGLPPDGQRLVSRATVYRDVAMRQLKRGSKRKTAPIIP